MATTTKKRKAPAKPKAKKTVPMPKVRRATTSKRDEQTGFPVQHYSASAMARFSSNPVLFKIEYINGDRIETSSSISSIVGKAFHKAMETYYGGNEDYPITSEGEAIEYGLKVGMAFLEAYNDGFINYTATIPTKQKAMDLLSFAFTEYIKKKPYAEKGVELISTEEQLVEQVDVEWKGQRLVLPVKLKAFADKVIREKGKLKIVDYKTTSRLTNHDRIDGRKILQAVMYYLTVYAAYGEKPYSITYEEVKLTKNKDGSPQLKEYEMVFEDNELYFDFFFRFYQDITDALNGKQVYVPNIDAFFDNEVAIVAYIHRLDESEEQAALMKKLKVDNITDLLRKKIQSAGNMRKLMRAVESQLEVAKNIDYNKMKKEEKIQTKMLEHGMVLQFDSLVEGASVDLYRYAPSIGLRMKRLEQYVADIEQVLGVTNVRILAPIPNTELVGFEIPRKERTFPGMAPGARNLRIPVGIDISGTTRYVELKTAPHILIAGTTGGGKSSTLRSILNSIGSSADLWLMDPKMVELNNIPSKRYADDVSDIMRMLKDLTKTMDERYKKMRGSGLREWGGRNIVAVIDEYADLAMQSQEGFVEWKLCGKHQGYNERNDGDLMRILTTKTRLRVREQVLYESVTDCGKCEKTIFPPVADSVVRLAQKGRSAGIHMIVATQRPSVDVITGIIKANFPTRMALRTASATDSEVILGVAGAEKLCGKGDMLLMQSDSAEIVRLQGFGD